uniref:Uncharacterized protein n=1 Tax=viral metagenome TaxID=1070528 RepID=A0A6M3L113_9ZZZZ
MTPKKRLYDVLQVLKSDLYDIEGTIMELACAATPYAKDDQRLTKAIEAAYRLIGENRELT